MHIQGGEKRKFEEKDEVMDEISFVGVSDMCEPDAEHIRNFHDVNEFHAETSGDMLDVTLVTQGCEEELKRFFTK